MQGSLSFLIESLFLKSGISGLIESFVFDARISKFLNESLLLKADLWSDAHNPRVTSWVSPSWKSSFIPFGEVASSSFANVSPFVLLSNSWALLNSCDSWLLNLLKIVYKGWKHP
jgi:hypothetical protein